MNIDESRPAVERVVGECCEIVVESGEATARG